MCFKGGQPGRGEGLVMRGEAKGEEKDYNLGD